MAIARKAHPEEFERIAAFYRDNDYRPAISPADVIVVAENAGALCGAVRICDERDVLVLRGMRVGKDMRRRGIGTHLLQAVEPVIGARECFCIPHRHLRSFYGRIGFVEVEAAEAPSFLRERCAEYRREYGLDVIVMRRPGGAEARRASEAAVQSSAAGDARPDGCRRKKRGEMTQGEEIMEEFYPMPLFVKLSVRDVAASAEWYQGALGFRSVYALAGDDGAQILNHLRLGRYQDLMLIAQPQGLSESNKGQGVVINLTTDDVDGLARRAKSAGARVEGPTETQWNTREVTVSDPDGYVLTFSQVADPSRVFSDVMPPSAS
jgi:uncharacterized glyoxalase superfamily protein PhnB/N-acetylglutamate synthase-like GNAT family acetyltransferase